MSRTNTPSDGYLVECERDGQTYILSGLSPHGSVTLVLTAKIAVDVAVVLTRMDAVTWYAVPAPPPAIASVP